MTQASIESDGIDVFVVYNGVRIAKRGNPNTRQAGTWVSLEPSYRVFDKNYPAKLVVEREGKIISLIEEETMSREQSLRNGAGLMVLGALIFLVYAVVFLFRAFGSSGFELGVDTLNGITTDQLDKLNPAIMGYITHLHVAIAGFIAATAIAAGGLAWYGVRDGLWWAWIIAVIVPVVGLAVALPMHYMGHFNYNWVSHLGPIYVGTVIYVVGALVALVGLTQATLAAAQVRR